MALKTRLIPIILFSDYKAVKTIQFANPRNVGSPVSNVKIYSRQKVDELIFLDINAYKENRGPFFEIVEDVIEESFMPLTIGGGIQNLNDIERLLKLGADKVSINTYSVKPDLIKDSANAFGSQCIVVSVDVKKNSDGRYEVYVGCGKKGTGQSPVSFCKRMQDSGAGEILFTSIDHEGLMKGYDLQLIRLVAEAVTIPVIANGGAGNSQHFVDAVVEGDASAVAASSLFHFTDQSPVAARIYMREKGLNVR
jgi:cyclase